MLVNRIFFITLRTVGYVVVIPVAAVAYFSIWPEQQGSPHPWATVVLLVLSWLALCGWVVWRGIQQTREFVIDEDRERQQSIAKEEFTKILLASPDVIMITRARDGHIVDVNQGFESINGHTRAEVLDRPVADIKLWVNPSDRDAWISRLRAEGIVRRFPAKIRVKSGAILDFAVSSSIIQLNGEDHVISISRDETENLAMQDRLAESEALFSGLFRSSPAALGVYEVTERSRGLYFNDAWCRLSGYTAEQAMGKTPIELNMVVFDHERDQFNQRLVQRNRLSDFTVHLRRNDGVVLTCQMAVEWVEIGSKLFCLIVCSDVSDLVRAREELSELNRDLEERVEERTRQLREANLEISEVLDTLQRTQAQLVQSEKLASLGSLVAGVAHELNTPLGVGLTTASTLEYQLRKLRESVAAGLRRSELDAYISNSSEAYELLIRSLTRACDLVSSFKQVATNQNGSSRSRIQLSRMVADMLELMTRSLQAHGVEAVQEVSDDLYLESNSAALEQVLSNLIANVLVHAFEPGQSGSLTIAARAIENDKIELTVRDNGKGIAPEHVGRVFDPFFTTRLGKGGSGLGLNVVYNLVTGTLGGEIAVQSSVGQGATFILKLPINATQV